MSNIESVSEIISQEHIGFSNALRNAREGKGLAIADIAKELHLEESVVYALENANLDQLPEPAYVCGYIRNYSKIMGLDADAIVNDYKKDVSLKSKLSSINGISEALEKKEEKNTVFFIFFLVLVLIVTGFISWQFWESKDIVTNAKETAENNREFKESVNENTVNTPQLDSKYDQKKNTLKESENIQSTAEIEESEGVSVPVTDEESPSTENSSEDFSAISSQETNETSESFKENTLKESIENVTNVNQQLTRDTPNINKTLEFKLNKNSWVSVKAANNESLVYDLIRKGKSLVLTGIAPIEVFLGDGTGVELFVNGKSYDFSDHINDKNIAKFKVN